VIFWCHLVAGVVAGTIVLMSVTAAAHLRAADGRLSDTHAPDARRDRRFSPDAIVASVQAANPGAPCRR
jgi:hypothetical protein